ncbi:hypothetical protein OAN307_c46380 [Octadecabacter antarcticus 307]|uniref:Uncharacterized protein n=1 Tax=Octadecabacter antarcticus 307 TaxID=391626 RepID=M9RCV2_9RHOB|nr:hypothetical protein [Octadecabacter antarcticus]AGI69987.1 hypothetical protein OAN307_c46380 [Octadecabacter antarcticus 307]
MLLPPAKICLESRFAGLSVTAINGALMTSIAISILFTKVLSMPSWLRRKQTQPLLAVERGVDQASRNDSGELIEQAWPPPVDRSSFLIPRDEY